MLLIVMLLTTPWTGQPQSCSLFTVPCSPLLLPEHCCVLSLLIVTHFFLFTENLDGLDDDDDEEDEDEDGDAVVDEDLFADEQLDDA